MPRAAAEEVKDSLRVDATDEELLHAERIGERLKELDAQPPASFEFEPHQENLQPPEDTADVLSVINGVIEYEEAAIETYSLAITAAREADDPVTEESGGDATLETKSPTERSSGVSAGATRSSRVAGERVAREKFVGSGIYSWFETVCA